MNLEKLYKKREISSLKFHFGDVTGAEREDFDDNNWQERGLSP